MQPQSPQPTTFHLRDVVQTPHGPGTVREIVRPHDGSPLKYVVHVPGMRRDARPFTAGEISAASHEYAS